MEKITLQKRILSFILIALLLVLIGLQAKDYVEKEGKYDRYYPILTDSPLYIPMGSGDVMLCDIDVTQNIPMSSLALVVVNMDGAGEGKLTIRVWNENSEFLGDVSVLESSVKVGEWNRIPLELNLEQGQRYTISVTAQDCEPYFMYVPDSGMKLMPFSETVKINGEDLAVNVSIGVEATRTKIKIDPASIALVILFVCIAAFPFIRIPSKVRKYGSDLFLILVYAFICIGIYGVAFKNGIYITSDSAGYLREAVNLYAGNGYSYDGLAGYDSWFANWPIAYPVMIFLGMLVTRTDAYIASKIISAVLVLLILVALRRRYREDAWIYSLVLLNLGFISLTYYTWSEMPFILFLLLFGFKLSDVMARDYQWKILDYVLLGLSGLMVFLCRYFGIYIWFVVGLYILIYLWRFKKEKSKDYLFAAIRLGITGFISGMLSIGYLLINRIQNGYASGVSRSDWWDDYGQLTKDLIDSLVTEVFNVFHIDISGSIMSVNYPVKAIFVIAIVLLIVFIAIKKCKLYDEETVFLLLGGIYMAVFTVIRYFSSMDTFYFRFFEPASFLICIGLLGIIIKDVKSTDGAINRWISITGLVIAAFICLACITNSTNGLTRTDYDYYKVAKAEWDKAYSEIPERSVVIFSDLDFRSRYYRPDVVEGELLPSDTLDDLNNRYYGSNMLVIQKEYAEVMLDSGEYTEGVNQLLTEGLKNNPDANKYISVELVK